VKKNTKTYILLAVVVVIWGMIGYRIISGITNNDIPETQLSEVTFKPLSTKAKKEFTIIADYRDPFLGTLPKKQVVKTKHRDKPKAPPMPQVKVLYTGFISDKDTKQNIFFVTINGTQHLMSPTNEIDKVKLLSGDAKSIKIRYNNKTKTIPLKE